MRVLIGLVADRMALLARPRLEASPFADGGTIAEWTQAAGVGVEPHHLLEPLKALKAPGDPFDVGRMALQHLALVGVVEGWLGGYRPIRTRPVMAARRANGSGSRP